ncbi:hypothetical protein CDV31_014749 [Fusarium ambrosium]|uniref:Uncharacterized protein n=1 Tax=Fusarium ambrosium TaxID=131363 RepID=A0A428SUA6_9HYPO|nr:hypothetical protein CDV31_014749 [Fusarium ambrosium]
MLAFKTAWPSPDEEVTNPLLAINDIFKGSHRSLSSGSVIPSRAGLQPYSTWHRNIRKQAWGESLGKKPNLKRFTMAFEYSTITLFLELSLSQSSHTLGMVLGICPRELRADLCDGIRVFHRHALAGQSFSSPVDFSQQPGWDALPTPNLPLILSTLHFAARRTSITRSRGSVIIDRYTSMRILHRRARSRGPMGPFRPLTQRSRPLLKPAG